MERFDLEEFEKLKDAVITEYKKIGSIYNPALKANIVFNANGIYHLRYDNNRSERNKHVQNNKLRFFQKSVSVLKIATTIQEYRRVVSSNKTSKLSVIEWFAFWAIISFQKKTRIKIIIKRIGGEGGLYHFWSVMPYWTLRHKDRILGNISLEDE